MKAGLTLLFVLVSLSCTHSSTNSEMLDTSQKTANVSPSKWRGFNLLNMFWKGWKEERFREEDFRLINELGFNFVRIPLDYRIWKNEPQRLEWLDEAVAYGEKYGVHVCLALHRAPGHSVSDKEPEPGNLWTDPALQEAFVNQWMAFAERYKKIAATRLSFNLLNEPTGAPEATIAALVRKTANAIFRISPDRLVIVDGIEWGTKPIKSLADLPIIQATRGYKPREIVRTTEGRPPPAWPQLRVNRYLYGDKKPDFQSRLTVVGDFQPGTLKILINQVSITANLQIFADGALLSQKSFAPGPGKGEWAEVIYNKQWSIYQNRYDRLYEFPMDRPAKEIAFYVNKGDWLTFSRIELGKVLVAGTDFSGGSRQGTIYLNGSHANPMFDKTWLLETQMKPWIEVQRQGVSVFVGETGAPKTSPHVVYLAWLRDNLENWKQFGWGWALWNFRGEFGIFDSERDDIEYEDFRGHKLDRKLLTLLQSYP